MAVDRRRRLRQERAGLCAVDVEARRRRCLKLFYVKWSRGLRWVSREVEARVGNYGLTYFGLYQFGLGLGLRLFESKMIRIVF